MPDEHQPGVHLLMLVPALRRSHQLLAPFAMHRPAARLAFAFVTTLAATLGALSAGINVVVDTFADFRHIVGDGLEFRHRGTIDRNLLPGQSFDVPQILLLIHIAETDGDTLGPGSTRAANAVDVGLR